jgi:hypothetical protein
LASVKMCLSDSYLPVNAKMTVFLSNGLLEVFTADKIRRIGYLEALKIVKMRGEKVFR